MIPLISKEIVEKKKWMTDDEMLDMVAIAESTPGVIAVNSATFVGYRVGKIIGAIIATVGVTLPSFIIICVISFFYDKFMAWPPIQAIFKGLKVGVILLLVNATIKLGKNIKINTLSIILFVIALSVSLVFTFIDTGFKYVSLSLIWT